ncbi:MAG: excinuclease ABC subunit UvrC [Candidatus Omnitrophica bacterium]|nr:excinuclease ABC subunit UvrC [Candidatus Omnitrophota bacterium]
MFHLSKLKNKLKNLPDACGVYIFKDAAGSILYIGKAKDLKKRVHSYFSRALNAKTQAMISKIADIEYRVTSSAAQAQILEAALIKDVQPQYNIDLKDDKSFPWIRITDEEFPLISIYRRKKLQKNDKSLYFGPYTNVKLLRQAFKLLRKIFGFRSCRKLPKNPCLYYRLKLCPAPCIRKISSREYKKIVAGIKMFLASKYTELLDSLYLQMKELSRKKKFEEAAIIRDRINALSAIAQTKPEIKSPYESEDLKNLLNLEKSPLRIEAFDISNIFGNEATGAMVSFYKGFPDKDNYRRFRIKTVEGIDDYAMLREVVQRRYRRLKEEKLPLPDLVLIDGGRQHLLAAEKELNLLGVNIPIVSIAKEEENIYTLAKPGPIRLREDTPALNLIRKIRDEAHRFALKYHHVLRRKKMLYR